MTILEWPVPEIRGGGRLTGFIGEIVMPYAPRRLDEWRKYRTRWQKSPRNDYSVWQEYRELLESGHNHYANRAGDGPYGWPEALVALQLAKQGFNSWTGVQLFRRTKGEIRAPIKRANTEHVLQRLAGDGFPSPRVLQEGVGFEPKNPDLVLYHSGRREWRFAEVKRDETVDPDQVNALALLHLAMRVRVAIIRLVPHGRHDAARRHPVSFDASDLPRKADLHLME
jgi:hypothetical protein